MKYQYFIEGLGAVGSRDEGERCYAPVTGKSEKEAIRKTLEAKIQPIVVTRCINRVEVNAPLIKLIPETEIIEAFASQLPEGKK